MHRFLSLIVVLCLGSCAPADDAKTPSFPRTDWPWWRGPNRDGIASADQQPPLRWSETENVLWKAAVPGRGHGAPIVVGDRVYLCAADDSQWLLCFDRKTGKELWRHEAHRGGVVPAGRPNAKASYASCTPACDGERIFVNFLNAGAVYATAVDLDGKRLWQTKIADYTLHQGFGASPAIYKSLVIVSADNKGSGAVAGLDRASGSIVWARKRPQLPNYTSPIIHTINGKDQLLFTGCDLVTSLDPGSGKEIWEAKGATTECVTSTVTDGQRIFTSGGYPKNHVSAIAADGSGKIAWETKTRVYVPSMWVRDGHLFAVTDDGIAMCWKSDTGQSTWSERLGGGFTASPVPVGDLVFATSESGTTFVFKATPAAFDLVGKNKLGDEILATATICGNRLYMRVAVKKNGKRQEMLYCIGN
ncbi:MAG TPA: PQQ-binding-like beta-propeller repeat protein [Urbifossiella sp.]|nr:PQQ-binding-like beta-propeller repeat protein [Urbifossiella sp.]